MTTISHTGKKFAVLALILAACFSFPILRTTLEQTGLEDYGYLVLLAVSVLVFLWCRYDAAERGRALPRGLTLGLIFVVIAGYPQYLHDIRGYSYKKAIGFAVVWILVIMGVMATGRSIML